MVFARGLGDSPWALVILHRLPTTCSPSQFGGLVQGDDSAVIDVELLNMASTFQVPKCRTRIYHNSNFIKYFFLEHPYIIHRSSIHHIISPYESVHTKPHICSILTAWLFESQDFTEATGRTSDIASPPWDLKLLARRSTDIYKPWDLMMRVTSWYHAILIQVPWAPRWRCCGNCHGDICDIETSGSRRPSEVLLECEVMDPEGTQNGKADTGCKKFAERFIYANVNMKVMVVFWVSALAWCQPRWENWGGDCCNLFKFLCEPAATGAPITDLEVQFSGKAVWQWEWLHLLCLMHVQPERRCPNSGGAETAHRSIGFCTQNIAESYCSRRFCDRFCGRRERVAIGISFAARGLHNKLN